MSETPVTEALESDPAISKRDVPARVWREMARLERERGQLIQLLAELNVAGVFDVPDAYSERARALLQRLGKEPS